MEVDTQDLEIDLLNVPPVSDRPLPSLEGSRTEEQDVGAEAARPGGIVGLMEESRLRQEEGEAQRRIEEGLRRHSAELQQQKRQQLRHYSVPAEGMSDTCSQSSDGEDLNRAIKHCHPPTNVDSLVPSHPLVQTLHCGKEAQLSSTGTESEPEQVAPGVYAEQRKFQVVPHVSYEKIKETRL